MGTHGIHWAPLESVCTNRLGIHGIHGYLINPWLPNESFGTHGIRGYPWDPWVPMEFHGYPWNVSMESVGTYATHGYPWIQWIPMESADPWNPWPPMESAASNGIRGCPWVHPWDPWLLRPHTYVHMCTCIHIYIYCNSFGPCG